MLFSAQCLSYQPILRGNLMFRHFLRETMTGGLTENRNDAHYGIERCVCHNIGGAIWDSQHVLWANAAINPAVDAPKISAKYWAGVTHVGPASTQLLTIILAAGVFTRQANWMQASSNKSDGVVFQSYWRKYKWLSGTAGTGMIAATCTLEG